MTVCLGPQNGHCYRKCHFLLCREIDDPSVTVTELSETLESCLPAAESNEIELNVTVSKRIVVGCRLLHLRHVRLRRHPFEMWFKA